MHFVILNKLCCDVEPSILHSTAVENLNFFHKIPSRAAADGVDRTLVRSPREDIFYKLSGQILHSRLLLQLSLALACIKALSQTLSNTHGSSNIPAPRLTSTSNC